jgi:hypothetical protein
MIVNKIQIDADRESRLDKCMYEIVDLLRHDDLDPVSIVPIMAARWGLETSEVAEIIQRAQALKQQQ